jgi:predicted nucleic acid-binding Zn finger protein
MAETTIPKTTRLQRGIRLFAERGAEIKPLELDTYSVPSCVGGGTYTVFLDLGCCTCPDHRRAKEAGELCKHRVAVEVMISKRRAARRRQTA